MMQGRSKTVTPKALQEILNADRKITLLDVRSAAEYRSGHIPGATLAPIEELTASANVGLLKGAGREADNPLYLTCYSGIRAAQAEQSLRESGLTHLVQLEGGVEAWQKTGLPLKRCGNDLSLERQVQIAVGSLLILKVVFGFTFHEIFFVIGAVIGAGLITAGLTRWCGMARLLARMPWNRQRGCDQPGEA